MLALINKLDGTNAELFHVEQSDNRTWLYQARWPGSNVAACREWGPLAAIETDSERLVLRDPTVPVEVRWRWQDEGVEAWQMAQPHEWGEVVADFHVIVKQMRDFTNDPVLQAFALVRGKPCGFQMEMPRRVISGIGAEVLRVRGRALHCCAASVLRAEGDFDTSNGIFAVRNAQKSQVTLLPSAPSLPTSVTFAGAFGIRLGKLSEAEIVMLREFSARETAAADK